MYNPYNNPYAYPVAQQRLQSMEQQFPQQMNQQNYYNNPMMTSYNQQILKGRAVTSFDEAKAAMIDLDGSIFVFPDVSNKAIYTKQINLDGTASVNVYRLEETPTNMSVNQNQGNNQKDVFAIADDISSMKEMLIDMQNKIEMLQQNPNNSNQRMKGAKINDQPVPNDATNSK